jgi:hypothetical protein
MRTPDDPIIVGTVYDPSDGTGDAARVGLPPWPAVVELLAGLNTELAYYEQLRARGRLVDAGVARCTVDHDLCSAVLRSPDFGSAVPAAASLPPPVRLAAGSPVGPPSPRPSRPRC